MANTNELANQNEVDCLDPYAVTDDIVQYDQLNPFYLKSGGSELRFLKNTQLTSDYGGLCFVCMRDQTAEARNREKLLQFYQRDTTIDALNSMAEFVVLLRAPVELINVNKIRTSLIAVDRDTLIEFNHLQLDLSAKELVVLMLETTESNVNMWIRNYQRNETLDDFIRQKIFTKYYGIDDARTKESTLRMISQVDDFRYWCDPRNCILNKNKDFLNRKFNLDFVNKYKINREEIDKELAKLLEDFTKNKGKCAADYPIEITDNVSYRQVGPARSDEDPSEKEYHSFYRIENTNDLPIDRETITELLTTESLDETEKYHLLCNLILSKRYCDYVLCNHKVLTKCEGLFTKYAALFRYIIGYAWATLHKEESIRKTRTKESDRFVFDIDTASALPVFQYCPNAPYLNPYFSCTIAEKLIDQSKSIGGVYQSKSLANGIVDLAEFKRRLNIFISGDPTKNLLEGACWDSMAVTGGCMSAICPKTNPLMMLYKANPDPAIPMETSEMNNFFDEYYHDSDVDVACNHSNIMDFISNVKHTRDVIAKNLGPDTSVSDIDIVPLKSLAIFINSDILKAQCASGVVPFDFDYIMMNQTERSVKFYFYEMYLELKKEANVTNKKILGPKVNDNEFFEIINYSKIDKTTLIINNCTYDKTVEVNNYRAPENNGGLEMIFYKMDDSKVFVKMMETLKFKIESKLLAHPFEFFRITEGDFFSCVARFHLNCVRSYFNGTNCYLLPSAVTAYHTFTNVDFKYFVGAHDPITIIDKYRRRGYGTVLNSAEVSHYLQHILKTDVLRKRYGITDMKEITSIAGPLKINHKFFAPTNLKPYEHEIKYMEGDDDIISHYMNSLPYDLASYRTINANGDINPAKRWVIDAALDIIGK